MQQLGYVPDPQARGLAFRRSFLIGLVYDNPTAQYIVNMQYGALDALRDSGFELVVHPCDSTQRGLHRRRAPLRAAAEAARRDPDAARVRGRGSWPTMLREIGCRYVRIASIPLDEAAQHGASPTTAQARHRSGQLPRVARPPHASA